MRAQQGHVLIKDALANSANYALIGHIEKILENRETHKLPPSCALQGLIDDRYALCQLLLQPR